ncbi:CLUMA_CG013739, isoform A [Clunio marinus]|uniref:CLUMA_CG013739, isoform A n=1 Tax=Clunio marinus TaxID=568069 RepID=A0A1J1IJQ7_9DIPT|nr:CLUMA_CG013739, isoform A [Clunio marinus]
MKVNIIEGKIKLSLAYRLNWQFIPWESNDVSVLCLWEKRFARLPDFVYQQKRKMNLELLLDLPPSTSALFRHDFDRTMK